LGYFRQRSSDYRGMAQQKITLTERELATIVRNIKKVMGGSGFFRLRTRRVVRRVVRRRVAIQKHTPAERAELTVRARALVLSRLEYFNREYHFTYHTVRIKDQRSRWGSCSSHGNLNFNYRIALLPAHLADYIVVHELCHLGQMNHSAKFWALVGSILPDYMVCRAELRKVSVGLL
jgi:predicted metal-dependent hydrolase